MTFNEVISSAIAKFAINYVDPYFDARAYDLSDVVNNWFVNSLLDLNMTEAGKIASIYSQHGLSAISSAIDNKILNFENVVKFFTQIFNAIILDLEKVVQRLNNGYEDIKKFIDPQDIRYFLLDDLRYGDSIVLDVHLNTSDYEQLDMCGYSSNPFVS